MKLAKRLVLTTTAVAAVTAGTLFSATVGQAATSQPARTGVDAPAALKVPDGNRLTGVFSAAGVQTYTCADGAWKLLEPAATLWAKNDRTHRPVALHSRGPVWVSTVDGSAVNAAAIANSPKTGTIPELLLQSTATRGTGVFAGVSYVQRLDTHGGVAPTTACTGTDQISVRYSATYAFYKPAK
ncbi:MULTISPECIES: DUF3455 domain-containing protein [Streptomyces]|uniref:DUF3455 domain-containing protein n=1 Tax=Streptomyces mirabilis TaxID=68239 RepID=A0ABU3UDQ3_9ACTN|nr:MULTISPECIES: DUF3455 domain-containing protein [Streptomyces]MCX4614225.1 DUF3455 domain-containing protein [Streptomyces mirabilis]MCX5354352.1 DUF3455 domain-containing protein [Streptomyces mirabilis]MDU8992068.1 DUF3455 domain-containing protein [Streptomyces mirabilis]NMI63035.1 DUF3455 domain-containing protein [Streptomyces sp. RLA2-12]QDN61993.1 DUF3455 domain-containing protein [Streptomyces sp. S1D4-20]